MGVGISRRSLIAGAAVTGAAALGLAGCGPGRGGAGASAADFTIATDASYAPFAFTGDDGAPAGIDVDLLAAAMEIAGADYELLALGYDESLAALRDGRADGVIAGVAITEELEEEFDCSDPYYDSWVCGAAAEGSGITGLGDARGMSVAVMHGTPSADWAESIAGDYHFVVTYFGNNDTACQDVRDGYSALWLADYPVAAYEASRGGGLSIVARAGEEYDKRYGLVVRKGEGAELLEAFDTGLAELRASGEYDEIVGAYLP